MSIASSIRPLVSLTIGLIIGAVGAVLFRQSLPGAPGSPEEQVGKLELQLKKAENRIRTLEASDRRGPPRPGGTFSDRARSLAEDLRAGREVTPDDILRACQPLMRDLQPLFDRIRIQQSKRMVDSMVGKWSRQYDLTAAQQESLKQWFSKKAEAEAKQYNDLATRDGTRVEDLIRLSMDARPDGGLDEFMPTILAGDKLAAFRQERANERATRVQREADMKVQRLDGIVGLDDVQRDQVFGIMARNSKDYDPSMVMEGGAGEINNAPAGDVNLATMAVLRPDQRQTLEAERQKRRDEAAEGLAEMGLSLPADWDMFDDFNF